MPLIAATPAEIEKLSNVGLCLVKIVKTHINLRKLPSANIRNAPKHHVPQSLVPLGSIALSINVPESRQQYPRRPVCPCVGAARAVAVLLDSPAHILGAPNIHSPVL